MTSSKSKSQLWDEWNDLVNLSAAELEKWLGTDQSKSVGDTSDGESTGHESGRKIVKILRTNKDDLTADNWSHMATVIGYIKRHKSQGGPDDDVEHSKWRYSLKNWGHDPLQ